jgi:hypothetical protein
MVCISDMQTLTSYNLHGQKSPACMHQCSFGHNFECVVTTLNVFFSSVPKKYLSQPHWGAALSLFRRLARLAVGLLGQQLKKGKSGSPETVQVG